MGCQSRGLQHTLTVPPPLLTHVSQYNNGFLKTAHKTENLTHRMLNLTLPSQDDSLPSNLLTVHNMELVFSFGTHSNVFKWQHIPFIESHNQAFTIHWSAKLKICLCVPKENTSSMLWTVKIFDGKESSWEGSVRFSISCVRFSVLCEQLWESRYYIEKRVLTTVKNCNVYLTT